MPKFSVWAARLALLYFLVGSTFGALLLINKAAPLTPALWSLLPLHIEFLLMGWIVQLVLAVGYWIFPRFLDEPKRGHPAWSWVSLVFLNAGIALVALSGFLAQPALLLVGRVLEVAAALSFGWLLWLRAKPTETGQQRSG